VLLRVNPSGADSCGLRNAYDGANRYGPHKQSSAKKSQPHAGAIGQQAIPGLEHDRRC